MTPTQRTQALIAKAETIIASITTSSPAWLQGSANRLRQALRDRSAAQLEAADMLHERDAAIQSAFASLAA